MNWKGSWFASSYNAGDGVFHSGSTWVANISLGPNEEPGVSMHWILAVSSYGPKGPTGPVGPNGPVGPLSIMHVPSTYEPVVLTIHSFSWIKKRNYKLYGFEQRFIVSKDGNTESLDKPSFWEWL